VTKARQRGSSMQKVILKGGSPRWRFRIDLEPGRKGERRQTTMTFKTEAEAVAAQAKARAELAAGVFVEPSKLTVNDWLDAWLDMTGRTLRPATRTSYRTTLLPVRGHIGKLQLQEVRREHVEQLVRTLSRERSRTGAPRSPRSVAYALTITKTALKAAVAEELIKRNPAEFVKAPVQPSKEMTTWTESELAAFLAHVAKDNLVGAWHLTALGLRRGEVLGLRWRDVDLERGVIHVRQARTVAYGDEQANERGEVVVEPKTKRGRRDVPLHPAAIEALRQTRQRTVLDSTIIPFAEKKNADRLVVVDALGNGIAPDVYGAMFARTAKAAGVTRIRLHDVRHTVATLLLQRGVPPVVVAGILGHSPAVLMTTYAHALPDAKRSAVELLGEIYKAG